MYETSVNASVEIQGPRVLEILGRTDEYADFSVIGFDGSITLRDFRPDTLASLLAFEQGKPNHDFADHFSKPAFVDLGVVERSSMHIELRPPSHESLSYLLWIAVGLSDSIPALDFVVSAIRPFEDNLFALVALSELEADHASSLIRVDELAQLASWPSSSESVAI